MILLAALLCNYGRGKCLIIIGTEGSLRFRIWPANYNLLDEKIGDIQDLLREKLG